LAAQALRAFAYGLGAVLLGVTLDERGFRPRDVGLVLAAVVAGTVLASVGTARWGDRIGRRRCYFLLYVALGATGVVFATVNQPWLLGVVALGGALSTEVVESGPFTSLEQAMLASELPGRELMRGFGIYNAVATAAGSLGSLGAAGLGPLRDHWRGGPTDAHWFLVFVPIAAGGAIIARTLSGNVEAIDELSGGHHSPLTRSRPVVVRLAALFAMDAFGGGFAVQAFVAFWLTQRFDASVGSVGVLFFAVGITQTVSFLAAPWLVARVGLLRTMVFTHLPSNVLLVAVAFAPSLTWAAVLLLARTALSQMDVPTRQTYVMALVDPAERTAAAAYTNTVRYVVRPAGPALAGAAQSIALGAPFAIAGTIKSVYDLLLWRWFRAVPIPTEHTSTTEKIR